MPRCTCVCGAKYKVSAASLGKESKCKHCGAVFSLVDDDQTLSIAPEVDHDELRIEPPKQGLLFTPSGTPGQFADDETFAESVPRSVLHRTYSPDVLWTVFFPTSLGNMLTFLAIWMVFALIQIAITPLGYLFIIAWFILFGWYAAFRFEIIASAASGEEDLPTALGARNLAADLATPMVGWIGSWIVVMFPAALYIVYALDQGEIRPQVAWEVFRNGVRGVLLGSTAGEPVLTVLIGLGVAVWPIVVLCIAVGGFSTLCRPDLMLRTVLHTLPLYVSTILLIAASLLFEAIVQSGKLPFLKPPSAAMGPAALAAPKFFVATVGLQVYMDIVRMRLIGLYYFHGKKGFAWSWE